MHEERQRKQTIDIFWQFNFLLYYSKYDTTPLPLNDNLPERKIRYDPSNCFDRETRI
jgi:hypothetical protein